MRRLISKHGQLMPESFNGAVEFLHNFLTVMGIPIMNFPLSISPSKKMGEEKIFDLGGNQTHDLWI